jgi:hypothetical protein
MVCHGSSQGDQIGLLRQLRHFCSTPLNIFGGVRPQPRDRVPPARRSGAPAPRPPSPKARRGGGSQPARPPANNDGALRPVSANRSGLADDNRRATGHTTANADHGNATKPTPTMRSRFAGSVGDQEVRSLPRKPRSQDTDRLHVTRRWYAATLAHAAANVTACLKGSSSLISLSRGAVASRSDGINCSSGRGQRMPTSGSLYAMPRSVASA